MIWNSVSTISNRGLESLINADFKTASDKLPYIEQLKGIIEEELQCTRKSCLRRRLGFGRNWLGRK